jgi:hypothetical protein
VRPRAVVLAAPAAMARLAVLYAPVPAAAGAPVQAATAGRAPLAPERNRPGDIPDSQVFVSNRSTLGFSL